MGVFTASINSGSNGNCYYVGTAEGGILIDAGLSCRETERRMQRLGLSLQNVRALFISHEHSDHIRGAEVISSRFSIPVYITERTRISGRLNLNPDLTRSFSHGQTIEVDGFRVKAFAKYHDASDPHSFTVETKGIEVGVMTDIGQVCSGVISHFQHCHAVYLEANYDEEMLDKGPYPWFLKNRIRSGHGHLSNRQALELFNNHRSERLKLLILTHLSKENNCPELVYNLFKNAACSTQITVASRYEESPLFSLTELSAENEDKYNKYTQMELF